MKIFNLFKPLSELEQLSQEEFDKGLTVLINYAVELEAEQVVEKMVQVGITQAKAIELYLFIPVAFCRQLIPEASYKDYYVDYYGPHKQIEKKYGDKKLYVAIEKATKAYFATTSNQESILRVCTIDAEFKCINKTLQDGSRLEDLEIAPSYITR